jgi:Fe-S cluster assembly iron-binding protein IscA
MPRLPPFTLTPAAVKFTADVLAEHGSSDVLRVCVYYVPSRQYDARLVQDGEPDDVRLDFPEGPLTVFVERESFMRLWGFVLDMEQVGNAEPGRLGLSFVAPKADTAAEDKRQDF